MTITAYSGGTKVFREDSFDEFNKGELKGVSLSSDGILYPGPTFKGIWTNGEELVWSMASGSEDVIYFSTGNEGKIFRMENGKAQELADLEEIAVFSMIVDSEGRLYAGASPGGKIYRFNEKGEKEVFFETGEEYVWDLMFDEDKNLFAATGTSGRLYKIDPDGDGEIYYETVDKNIMDIMMMQNIEDDAIYLGTHDKGRVYRVYEERKAFVLYDSGMDEVRALAEGEDGHFYAAINSAKASPQPQSTPQQPSSDENKNGNGNGQNQESQQKTGLSLPVILGKQSAIVKLDMAGFHVPVLHAPESPIHFMVYDDEKENILAGIGDKGKLYEVKGLKDYSVVLSVDQKHVLSYVKNAEGTILGTGQTAALYNINWDSREDQEYISPVHDAMAASQWGKMLIEGKLPKGSSIELSTRSGNTEEPDKTWSEWTKKHSFKDKTSTIKCPVARFYQYKLLLSGKNEGELPEIDGVASYYLVPNRAPLFEEIKVETAGGSKNGGKNQGKNGGKSNDSGNSAGGGASIDTKAHSNPKKLKITWKVHDPDGDKMLHTLYFKGIDDTGWLKIEDKIDKNSFEFSTESIPDGRYLFKVETTDLPDNPKSAAKTSAFVSDPRMVDNTPPEFIKDITYDDIDEKDVVIYVTARDEMSVITSAQYTVNADEWYNIHPEDEIFDSKTESFAFFLRDLEEKQAVVGIMITDSAGNTAVGKVLVNID